MSVPREALHRKVRQWAQFAEDDFRAAQQSLKAQPPLNRIAAFHAQQCAEKYLKALLVCHEADFPFTHDLSVLLDLSTKWLPKVDELDDALSLSVYAVMMRYPGVVEDVSLREARAAIVVARRIRDAVRQSLAEEGLEF